jgi:cellobiose-specific phosphotransferase system component IIA
MLARKWRTGSAVKPAAMGLRHGEKHRRLAVAKKDKSKKAKKLIKKAKKMMKKAKKEIKKLKEKEKASNTKVDRQDAPPTSPFSS